LLATAGVTLILIVPAFLIANAFVRQGFQAAQEIQSEVASGRFHWVNELWARIQARFPEATSVDLSTLLHQYAESATTYVAGRIGAILRHMAVFLFHLSVTILAMFYLFRDGEALLARIREVLPFEVSHRDRMLREAHDLVFASVASTFVAAIF